MCLPSTDSKENRVCIVYDVTALHSTVRYAEMCLPSTDSMENRVCIVYDVTAVHSTVRYAEMCLPSCCLETDCIIGTAVSVAERFLRGVNTPQY
jgi:hypothetical protein